VQKVDGVVKLLDSRFVGRGNLALIMERLPGPDLYDFISNRESAMDEDMAHCLFKQALRIVIECYNLGIVHRDIKDENLVFDDTDHLKLIDFGCAAFYDHAVDGAFHVFAGTLAITPPEWFKERTYHAESYTVWQLGCLLFNMLCGDVPFKSESETISGNIPWTRDVSDACRSLVEKCLKKSPTERPSLMQILEHAWIRQTVLSNAQSD
jgi:protein-serine/threonine kinase